jgi:signal transduction histidine kinase
MERSEDLTQKSLMLERERLRQKWHDGPSQKLLGLAFGTKLLAIKLAKIDSDLATEADRIAELTNEAVQELQEIFSKSEI